MLIQRLRRRRIGVFSAFRSIFYFPDRESTIIVKKIGVEILMNLHILRSQESEKVFFFLKSSVLCTLYLLLSNQYHCCQKIKVRIIVKSDSMTSNRLMQMQDPCLDVGRLYIIIV